MSDPGIVPEAPDSTIEQDGAIPETVIPAEPAPETPEEAPDEPAVPAAEAAATEAAKPAKKPWFQERIDTLTRKAKDAERERDELKAKLPTEEAEAPAFDPKAFDSLVKQEAARQIQAEKAQERGKTFVNAGVKDFGSDAFNEKCAMVAAMGAGDSPEFMQIITDAEIIPDGHKVVAALADNPEEAQRILALEPIRMAAALTRFAETHKTKVAPAAISSAPAPIRPTGSSAKPSAPSDTDDIKSWMAKRNAEAWDTRPRN